MQVIIRNPTKHNTFGPSSYTYIGELVATPSWVPYDAIAMTTNESGKFRVRIIAKDDIISIDGEDNITLKPSKRIVCVKGSKGDEYTVELSDKGNSCNCSGFQFRRTCRHIQEAMNG
jgi:hypothetical protein